MSRDALSIIEQRESGGRNVPNYKYGPGFTASGHFQMINSTWKRWARAAGIDVSQYPTAMSAPYDVQRRVAQQGFNMEGFRPWEATKHLVGQEKNYTTQPQVSGVLGDASPVSSAGGATPAQVKQAYDLAKYAARQGIDVSGFGGALNQGLGSMFAALPPELQGKVQIGSGYRSPEYQKGLWENALRKYGSEAAARKWVAPPGRSQHGFGNAADLKYLSPEAKAWVHSNATKYGLALPLGNEPWHIEAAGSRVGGKPVNYALGSGGASPSTALALGGSGGDTSGGAGVGGGQPAQSASAPAQATPEQRIAGGIGGLIDAFTGGGEQAAPASAPSPLSQPMMQPMNQPEQNGAAQMMASLLDRKRQSYTPNQPGIFQKGPFA